MINLIKNDYILKLNATKFKKMYYNNYWEMVVVDALKEYIIYNWALILVLIAFVIMLMITVFIDKKTKIRMYILIGVVFLFS